MKTTLRLRNISFVLKVKDCMFFVGQRDSWKVVAMI